MSELRLGLGLHHGLRLRLNSQRLRLDDLRLYLHRLGLRLDGHLGLRLDDLWLSLNGLRLCVDHHPLGLRLRRWAVARRRRQRQGLGLRQGLPAGAQGGRHVAH